jgi:C4-type Zn-finger protein
MLDKITRSLVRCPKCNGAMKLVEDPPHFAIVLLPSRSYRCDPCRIALSYPPDELRPTRRVRLSKLNA